MLFARLASGRPNGDGVGFEEVDMGSDRARVSYDENQQYRSVVMQQGRVTLEADWNEAEQIASEQIRKEALDFVGPTGTPDNGYQVSFLDPRLLPPFNFSVGLGTMYVGGVRAYLGSGVQYSQQKEWLDHSDDPDWVDPSTFANNPPTKELVYLYLREQEVSAVEDWDLKDVALGGPDTAQRTRLLQHIVRLSTQAPDCAGALAAAVTKWGTKGLSFDPQTLRLNSLGTLQASFSPPTGTTDPCQPQAQGGYLGSDNQLIRVQISGVDQASGNPKLLWGLDDASFLYRVDVINSTTLHLQTVPVDANHQPRSGQAVEVLRPAAQLSNGEYVASPTGFVTTVAAAYNPDTHTIGLSDNLPQEYGDGTAAHPSPPKVFLRVWEQEMVFTPGTAVELGSTGLQVTLQLTSGTTFHVGDYWLLAVRPSTPQQVYPERYLSAFQPPDGPRLWACPLSVIGWGGGAGTILDDCRKSFDNLVDLTKKPGGCDCAACVTADSHNQGKFTIQNAIDQVKSTGGKICLGPGIYQLTDTVAVRGAASLRMTGRGRSPSLEAAQAGSGTVLMAPPTNPQTPNPAILIDSSFVTVEDLTVFTVDPEVAITTRNPGVMIQNGSSVTIQRCGFFRIGNRIVDNPAIALGGLVREAIIRDNVLAFGASGDIQNGTGIAHLATLDEKKSTVLSAESLYILDNTILAHSKGISLEPVDVDGHCVFGGYTRISGNAIFGSSTAGIVVDGRVLSPFQVEIDGNLLSLGLFAAGIVCGVDPARISNNIVAGPIGDGIVLGGLGEPTIESCQVVGNRVTWVGGGILRSGGVGIHIGAVQLGSAVIEQNILQGTAGGIIMEGGSSADYLSLVRNQLLGLAPTVGSLTSVVGIGLQLAQTVEIVDNRIQDLGLDSSSNATRVGILLTGCTSLRIAGNEVFNIGPPDKAVSSSAGIAILAPFDRAEVSGNYVSRAQTQPQSADLSSAWRALFIGSELPQATKVGLLGSTEFFLAAPAADVAPPASSTLPSFARIPLIAITGDRVAVTTAGAQMTTVRGNWLEAFGSAPTADIAVIGTCIFSENQCFKGDFMGTPGVAALSAPWVIASGNNIQGPFARMDIKNASKSPTLFTCLGNVTNGLIYVDGSPLTDPWKSLNRQ